MLLFVAGSWQVSHESTIQADDESWTDGPNLPLGTGLMGHCLCPRTVGDKSQFIVAGGEKDWSVNDFSKSTFQYSFQTETWIELSDLPQPRAHGTCSPFTKSNGDQLVIYLGKSGVVHYPVMQAYGSLALEDNLKRLSLT